MDKGVMVYNRDTGHLSYYLDREKAKEDTERNGFKLLPDLDWLDGHTYYIVVRK